ncbi:MAG: aldehyde dehydrogenase family protein [Vampirovibrionales bacterium]|nr:aldehyde dehydrogenase family protein [Vampirovibrionales bacterium]
MSQRYELYINGQWQAPKSGQYFESLNPASGEVVAEIARGQKEDIDAAVKAARKAFDEGPWAKMSQQERSEILQKVASELETQSRLFVGLLINESGATLRKAKTEAFLCGKYLNYFAKAALKINPEESIENLSKPGVSENLLVREPIGVCGQITPWNFPLQMPIWKIGPALVMGNTVVLKPAEETSAIVLELVKLFEAAGLPKGVLNVVTGYGKEAGAALSQHPLVDKIAFTGSTEVGKLMMQDASHNLKKITLELGGKSANIVLEDADLDQAVDAALYAIYYHSGQACTAGTRLLLQESIHDRFVEKFLEKAKAIQIGLPEDKATDMGPLVSKKQQERVLNYIEIGKKEGATCVLGGNAPEDPKLTKGHYVSPTVFINVDNKMRIAQEEIFGPVISILSFKTPEEAIEIANDSIYGLAGAVWSKNDEKALSVARQLRTGTVWINDYHLISEKAPFGGYKQSGIGRELGEEGLLEYTETKHIHIDQLKARDKKFWYDSVLAPKQPVG